MANEFKYTIRADDKSKPAVQSAKREMRGMEDSAKRLGNVLKGAFTVGAIVAVGRAAFKAARELEQAYAVQERAERKLAAAVRANPMMDPKSATRIREFASELQGVSTIGDETTISMAGMLAAMGRNEDQITDLMQAAADLSAATGISLDSAVRNLNKTFGGLTGELGELMPELKNLTTEQLMAGDAITVVREQFDGMAESMRDTVDGSMKAFSNAWGDLKEEMGERAARRMQPIRDFFTGLITDLTDAVAKQNDFIANQELIEGVASGARGLGGADADPLIAQIQNQLSEAYRSIHRSEMELERLGSLGNQRGVGVGIEAHESNIAKNLESIAELEHQLAVIRRESAQQQEAAAERARVAEQNAQLAQGRSDFAEVRAALEEQLRVNQNLEALWEDQFDLDRENSDAVKTALETLVGMGYNVSGANIQTILDIYGDHILKPVEKMSEDAEDLSTTLSDVDLQFGTALMGINQLGDVLTNQLIVTLADGVGELHEFGDAVRDASGTLSQVGNVGESFTDGAGAGRAGSYGDVSIRSLAPGVEGLEGMLGGLGDTMTAALGPIGILVGEFMKLMSNIKAVQELLAPLGIVLDGILAVIGPVLNEGLAPLVGIFHMIGQVIGHLLLPVLELLFPIVQAMANAFVWLYNKAFVPVYNVLREFGNRVYNFFVDLVNWVIRALNSIPFVDIGYVSKRGLDHGKLDEIDVSDLSDTGSGYLGEGGGSPASYTTGRNITINMVVNTDALVGEDGIREFALMIRDEIYSAEALGA